MIRQADIARYLDDWLGNEPMAPADRVVVSVAVRISRQKQRPAPRIAWALADLFGSTRLLAGIAAAVLVALVGFAFLQDLSPQFGGRATPPPTATLSPAGSTQTPLVSPSTPPPPIDISVVGGVPANWRVTASGLLSFSTEADGHSMSIEILANRSVMAANCDLGPEPGVGSTADAFIAAIAARPGLIATNEGAAEVGGRYGRQVDVRIDPSSAPPCPGEVPGDEFVPLFGVATGEFWSHVGASRNEQYRLIVVDAPREQNVVISILANDPQAFDQFIDDATTIVSRLTFDFG